MIFHIINGISQIRKENVAYKALMWYDKKEVKK